MENLPRKRARGKTHTKSENDEEIQTSKKPLNSTVHLTYDVLRIIFRYLNGLDLSRVAMVCRSWLEAANNEKRTRGPTCFVKQHPWDTGLYDSFKNEELKIKPSIGLFFSIFTRHTKSKHGCYCNLLPKNCEIVMLHSTGVVVNNIETEDMLYDYDEASTVCAFLPEVPNVTISTFNLSTFEKSTKLYERIFNTSTSDNNSTCLMLFSTRSGRHLTQEIVQCIKRCYQEQISSGKKMLLSLWGGVVTDLYICNKANKRNCTKLDVFGVLITGSIQTWSIVIDRKCATKEQVEAKLTSFKSQVNLGKHSIGFMFACHARGKMKFNEANVESTIFKKLFPHISLAGCFGDGEFGKNMILYDKMKNDYGKHTKEYKNLYNDSWYKELSTVFMILTYG